MYNKQTNSLGYSLMIYCNMDPVFSLRLMWTVNWKWTVWTESCELTLGSRSKKFGTKARLTRQANLCTFLH